MYRNRNVNERLFFYSKKDIRRKTSVKKIPFANMQSRQYQQKSMIPADRQRLCIVILPMYEKNIFDWTSLYPYSSVLIIINGGNYVLIFV